MGSVIPLKKSANSAYLELKNLLSDKLQNVENLINQKLKSNQKEFGKHSGLGLSISKQIISAHNGDIFAENIINDDKKIIGARVNIILNK